MRQQTNVTEIEVLHPSIIISVLGLDITRYRRQRYRYKEFDKQKSCHFTGMGNNLSKKQRESQLYKYYLNFLLRLVNICCQRDFSQKCLRT